jgi:hypothetical protein
MSKGGKRESRKESASFDPVLLAFLPPSISPLLVFFPLIALTAKLPKAQGFLSCKVVFSFRRHRGCGAIQRAEERERRKSNAIGKGTRRSNSLPFNRHHHLLGTTILSLPNVVVVSLLLLPRGNSSELAWAIRLRSSLVGPPFYSSILRGAFVLLPAVFLLLRRRLCMRRESNNH